MANGQSLATPPNARLTLTTLGRASLSWALAGGSPTHLLGPGKPLALIAYLAFSPRRTASRDYLVSLLWADSEPDRALHAMRQAVWQIRHALGEQVLATRSGGLALEAELVTDRDAFIAEVEAGNVERAVALYTGDFLPDFAAPGGAEFEQWADLERIRLRTAFLRSAESLTRRYLASGKVREAQRVARRARDTDRLNEGGWRLLLETLEAGNDWTQAAMEADALEGVLHAESREAEPATRAALRRARKAPDEAPASPRNALVAELVGREKEFAAILAAWDDAKRGAARHVHVTAPAGLGKTRLLQDVHARLRAAGARTAHVRAHAGGRAIAYALAADLAATLAALPGAAGLSPGAAAALVSLNPSLSSRYTVAPATSRREDALRHRSVALAELLATVADEAPVAILVDDLHWADAESRQVLVGLAARLDSHRLLLVTAARPAEERLFEGAPTTIRLLPLDERQVAALVTSLAALPDEPWARDLPARLAWATGGSPLLLLESLQLAMEREALVLAGTGWTSPDPAALAGSLGAGSALRRRLEELDPAARWLILSLAAAGTPMSATTLARAAGRPEELVLPALGALEERGLVSRAGTAWEVAHDELAALALEAIVPETLRDVCGALGRALTAELTTDPEIAKRAAPLLAAARDDNGVAVVLRTWLDEARRRGDRRPPDAVASELLGDERSGQRVRDAVRRLPLSVRWGLDLPGRRAGVGAALLVLVAAAVVGLVRPTSPPPDAALLVATDGGTRRAELRRETWDRSDNVPTKRTDFRWPQGWSPVRDLQFQPAPLGGSWLTTRVFPDAGGIDLVQLFPDGRPARRLASAPGDDGEPSWAPDGSAIAFSTARWNALSHYDLAVLDSRSGEVRSLTLGDARDFEPVWSPDGTRIAFGRLHYDGRPAEVCWMTLDGITQRCHSVVDLGAPAAGRKVRILGWRDDRHLLAQLGSDQAVWFLVDVATGVPSQVSTVALDGAGVLSPEGRWVVGRGAQPEATQSQWLALSVDRPTQARPIAGAEEAGAAFWDAPSQPRPWLDTLRIELPPGAIPLNTPHRLKVRGMDQHGRAIPVRALSWSSANPSIATIDTSGTVWPRRPGRVVIGASAGGWRADSVAVEISAPQARTILRWSWDDGIGPDWVPFGEPRPRVVHVADMAALWNHGDSSFESGVYSRRTFGNAEGLGIEARISARISAVQWQTQMISLDSRLDSTRLAGWDHRTGGWPGQAEMVAQVCSATYPSDEGAGTMGRLGFGGGAKSHTVEAPPDMATGAWHLVRVQLLPDGRCGFAVDGVPAWLSPEPVALNARFRFLLQGRSHGTQVLVGPVELWTGVRDDVDWRIAEAP